MNKKIKKRGAAVTSIFPVFEFMETLDLALKFIFSIVVIMLTGLFFIFLHDFMIQSKYLSITQISIKGLNRLTQTEALTQAGLKPGDTLLNINAFKMKKRLVAHPWIKAAEIKRLPPHALEIFIQEEVPLARVAVDGEPPLLINTQGIPFTQCPPQTSPSEMALPLIKGLTLEEKEEQFGFYDTLYQDVLSLLTHDFGYPITAITADNATGIAVETRFLSELSPGQSVETPITLKLGFRHFKSKFATAGKIFHYLEQQALTDTIATMDLFNPERVIVTPGRHAAGAATTATTGGA